MKRRQDIMLDVAKIAGTRYLVRALLFVKSIVVMRLLAPSGQGLVTQVSLVQTYGSWTDLGLNGALTRQLPTLGDTDADRAHRQAMMDTGASSIALFTGVMILIVLALAMGAKDSTTRACLAISAGIVALQMVMRYFENLLRVQQEFGVIARSFAVLELSGLFLSILLTWLYGAPGFFAAALVAHVIASGFLIGRFRQSGGRLGWRWDPGLTGRMVLAGFPLAGTSILHTLFLSLDRLVLGWTVSDEALGHYTLALLVAAVIQFIPDSVGYILFPSLRQRAGQVASDQTTLRRYLREPTEIISWVIPFFIAGALLVLPAVPLVLPAYAPGLEPAKVLTLFTFFTAINTVAMSHLTAFADHWRKLNLLQASITLGTPFLLLLALRSGQGAMAAAWAMGAAYLVYGLSSQALALRTTGLSVGEILRDLVRICLPMIYLVPVLRGIDALVAWLGLTGLPAVFAGFALFIPASVPLLWGIWRRTPIPDLARKALKRA